MTVSGLVGVKIVAEFWDLKGTHFLVGEDGAYFSVRAENGEVRFWPEGDVWAMSRKLANIRKEVEERVTTMRSMCYGNFPAPKGQPQYSESSSGWCSMCKVMHGETDRCPY